MMSTRWTLSDQLARGTSWLGLQHGWARPFKRWRYAGLGSALGACVVFWLASDAGSAHERAQQAVDTARGRLQAQPALPAPAVNQASPAASSLWPRLTGHLPDDIWIQLQQALTAQGVQVVSIRVLPHVQSGVLQSQSVALRLNASSVDWVNAWRGLTDAGPVLSMDRISASPMATSSGVQLDVVMRLWFKPGSEAVSAGFVWPVGSQPVTRRSASGTAAAEVFAHPGSASAAPRLSASEGPGEVALLSTDPLRWPLARIRLLGTWQLGTQWQAVLGAGGAWVPVQRGQRVSLEGHKVESIHHEGVILRSAQGEKLVLKWPGGGP